MTGRAFLRALPAAALLLLGAAPDVTAQPVPAGGDEATAAASEGARTFAERCATCHSEAQSGRTPSRAALGSLSPRAIVAALEDGVMRAEGAELGREQRIAVAEYLSGRSYSAELLPETAYCADRGWGPLDPARVSWMGYGGDVQGTGFQPGERAGLTASDVPKLELRWAFGFPDASQVRTKPTVVGDVVLVGGPYGEVLALDAGTGCVRWAFEADAGVRGAVLLGEGPGGRSLAYFVDQRTNAYALDVADGSVVWKTRVGWHPESMNTGSPALHDGRLVVPISSGEVGRSANPEYRCCTSSGAVAALDAGNGYLDWYHRVVPGYPEEVGTNEVGTPLFAPSGAPVWSSPTVDPERGRVYAGTGENYTRPASATSDAVLAIDLETGELAWSFQATGEDAWNFSCSLGSGRRGPNCPAPVGPDHDFGMSPIVVKREDGRDVLVAGQKSGTVWALDPDAGGEVLWSTKVGKGGALGGVHWGMATDGRLVFAAVSDRSALIVDTSPDHPPSPGLYALDLMDGEVVWSAPAPGDTCGERPRCHAAYSAAPTVIPGVVFAGGLDGHIRAYSTDDGRLLWDYDTARELETVSGAAGRGGAIDGPGPVVAGGTLYVNSGYGSFGQMPGNLLLAFGVPGR